MVQVQISNLTGMANHLQRRHNLQRIEFEMRSVQGRYPERRAGAIDENDRVVDLV